MRSHRQGFVLLALSAFSAAVPWSFDTLIDQNGFEMSAAQLEARGLVNVSEPFTGPLQRRDALPHPRPAGPVVQPAIRPGPPVKASPVKAPPARPGVLPKLATAGLAPGQRPQDPKLARIGAKLGQNHLTAAQICDRGAMPGTKDFGHLTKDIGKMTANFTAVRKEWLNYPWFKADAVAMAAKNPRHKFNSLIKGLTGHRAECVFKDFESKPHKNLILHTTKDWLVLVNGKSYNMNHYPVDLQHNAGQSFVHLLIIPRHAWIFNAVTIARPDVFASARAALHDFLKRPNWHQMVGQRNMQMVKKTLNIKGPIPKCEVDYQRFLVSRLGKLRANPSHFALFIHDASDISVPWLHFHATIKDLLFRKRSSSMHDDHDRLVEAVEPVIAKEPMWKMKTAGFDLTTAMFIGTLNAGKGLPPRAPKGKGKGIPPPPPPKGGPPPAPARGGSPMPPSAAALRGVRNVH